MTLPTDVGSRLPEPPASPGRARPDAAELPAGEQLHGGRFVVGRVLGRGGFGITYETEDTRLSRKVALKELFPDAASRHGGVVVAPPEGRDAFAQAKERFLREARVLARFSHPGIVHVFEVFEEHGTAYLVLELLDGETLSQVLRTKGAPFSERAGARRRRPGRRRPHRHPPGRDAPPRREPVEPRRHRVGSHRPDRLRTGPRVRRRADRLDDPHRHARLRAARAVPRIGPLRAGQRRLRAGRHALPAPHLQGAARPRSTASRAPGWSRRTGSTPRSRSSSATGSWTASSSTPGTGRSRSTRSSPASGIEAASPVVSGPVGPPPPVAAPPAPAPPTAAPFPRRSDPVAPAARPAAPESRAAPAPVPAVATWGPPPVAGPAVPDAAAYLPGPGGRPTAAQPLAGDAAGRRRRGGPHLRRPGALHAAARRRRGPALATAGDLLVHRARATWGIQDGWADRQGAGTAGVARFARNLVVSAARSLPVLAALAVLIAVWYPLHDIRPLVGLSDWYLRAVGLGVGLLVVVPALRGSATFASGIAVDEVHRRVTPSGRGLNQAGIILWLVCLALTAIGLLASPEVAPLGL